MTDAQFELLMARLTEMRNLLAYAIEGPAPSTDPPVCEHPEDQRIDLSTLRRAGFQCRACGYQQVVDRRTGEPLTGEPLIV